jgi:hypothetical protein
MCLGFLLQSYEKPYCVLMKVAKNRVFQICFRPFEKQKFNVLKYINTIKVHTRPKFSILFLVLTKFMMIVQFYFQNFLKPSPKFKLVLCVYGVMEFISNPCKCITQDM